MHGHDKLAAAAMHRDHHVRRQPLELGNREIDIILRRRAEMKPAEYRVQFADAGHRHRRLYRVDEPDMSTRRDDDEPASPDDITRRVFVRMLVRDEAA